MSKRVAILISGGGSNMVALGLLARWLDFEHSAAQQLIAAAFDDKGDAIVKSSLAGFTRGFNKRLQQAPAHGLVHLSIPGTA